MQRFLKIQLMLILSIFVSQSHAETAILRLAITHTTENSGLVSRLNPVFESDHNVKINTVIVGSGQALRLGQQGDVDVLLTHAPEDEQKFVEEGYGIKRYPVMHNDFILIGPATDPANVKGSNSVFNAFEKILQTKTTFISRGDDSGTHKKEKIIWKETQLKPDGEWYISAGLGMGQVLLLANEKKAYTLTDRGTYLAFKDRIDLDIQYQGDEILNNPYHVIAVNPGMDDHINTDLANTYIKFLTGRKAQNIIKNYKLYGEQLFIPDVVAYDEKQTNSYVEKQKSFFLDAIISSLNLIVDFDKELFFVVWTSLKVSILAVLIASLISLPLGVVVALNRFIGKGGLLACLNTLMALPTVVVGLLLYGLLNRQGLLGDMGLLYTPTAMVMGQCLLITPVIWNLCIAAVNSADPRLARTCSSLGASFIQRCLIYMSEVRFALIAAVVTGFGRAIGEVGIAMMLGGNIDGYTRTMTTAIALETSKGAFEFALALGFMLLLVAFIVNAMLQRFQVHNK